MVNMNKSENHNIELEKAICKGIDTVWNLYQVKKCNILSFIGTLIGNKNIKTVTEIINWMVTSEEKKEKDGKETRKESTGQKMFVRFYF